MKTTFKQYIREMTIKAGPYIQMRTKDQQESVKLFLLQNRVKIESIEGDKFDLCKADDGTITHYFISLRNTEDVLSFISIKETNIFNNDYSEILNMFTFKEFRNKGYIKVLLYWIRIKQNKKLLIRHAVFDDGEYALISLVNDNRFGNFLSLNLLNGEEQEVESLSDYFSVSDKRSGLILESLSEIDNLYSLPGQKTSNECFCFFEEIQ